MSQNIPPNQDQQDPNNPYASQDAQDQYQSYGNQQGNSPYTYQQTSPNLDANAPTLSASDLQKINRKGLFFLGGIILLLLLAAAWLWSSAGSKDKPETKQLEETVEVPKLKEAPVVVEEPIPLAQPEPSIILPPQLPEPPPEEFKPQTTEAPPQPRGPTLAERRMMNSGGGNGPSAEQGSGIDPTVQAILAQGQAQAGGGNQGENKSESAKATRAQFLNGADSLLVRGTYIRCVLETRIISDLPGFTSCVVTEPVYSINGKRLLLPKGSKVYGSYNTDDPKFPRIAVVWDRVTTPTGIDVSMASPGVDNLGSSGHPGYYNAHWGSKVSSALLISLVSDVFKYYGEKEGPQTQTVTTGGQVISTPFQSNTARTMEKIAEQAVERNLSRPATVTINQGTILNVYVAKDVSFANVVGR
jgi:type IV secretion system protein VirB10